MGTNRLTVFVDGTSFEVVGLSEISVDGGGSVLLSLDEDKVAFLLATRRSCLLLSLSLFEFLVFASFLFMGRTVLSHGTGIVFLVLVLLVIRRSVSLDSFLLIGNDEVFGASHEFAASARTDVSLVKKMVERTVLTRWGSP
jgi:hypothetical protein